MVHGMAAGLAFYAKNFAPLSRDRDVFALDWPGFARSSRPNFDDGLNAEKQFVDSLEQWRKNVGVDKFILLGHSFGGYLAASYALTYPEKVDKLLLVDPWGMPERPENYESGRRFPWWARTLYSVFKHFNPLASLRLSGPWGKDAIKRLRPDLIAKYSSAFENEEDGQLVIPDYMFHCNAQSPTGESAFSTLMTHFAWAKYPMLPRLADLNPEIPLRVFYGGDSWMTRIEEDTFLSVRGDKTDQDRTSVSIINGAGHHVYAERSEDFNRQVNDFCQMRFN